MGQCERLDGTRRYTPAVPGAISHVLANGIVTHEKYVEQRYATRAPSATL